MERIQTDRLVLRMFHQGDFKAYAHMMADPEVTRFLGNGSQASGPEAWRHMAMIIGHWQLLGYGPWAVEERDSGELIGRVGPFYPEGWPEIEVGWMLRPQSWGLGYATEGARAALDFVFATLQLAHVVSMIRPDNHASIRVAERLGERLEDRITIHGEEALVYGLNRQEWEQTAG